MAQDDKKLLCIYDGLVSRCTQISWRKQELCPFSMKAKSRDECLYYCDDGRCWYYPAQDAARGINQLKEG